MNGFVIECELKGGRNGLTHIANELTFRSIFKPSKID
jgi:hypothetical protein